MHTINIATSRRECLVDVTDEVRSAIDENKWRDGILVIFCPHTTCGLTINEGADPDVALDIVEFLRGLVPKNSGFRHMEGNSDAHIKASFLGSSLNLIVEDGKLRLGTWQAVYLFEGDGPRGRAIWAKWQGTTF